jgi:hypothetical protein
MVQRGCICYYAPSFNAELKPRRVPLAGALGVRAPLAATLAGTRYYRGSRELPGLRLTFPPVPGRKKETVEAGENCSLKLNAKARELEWIV